MYFDITANIQIELERAEGKFASRDEMEEKIEQAIIDALESISSDQHEGEAGGLYDTTSFDVSVEFAPAPTKADRARARRERRRASAAPMERKDRGPRIVHDDSPALPGFTRDANNPGTYRSKPTPRTTR